MTGHLLSLVLAVSCLTYNVEAFNFTHNVTLDKNGAYQMWWMLGDDEITVKVTVKTTGWIGWGISPNGVMKGADMVIGWIDKNGDAYFTDRHGRGNFEPIIDAEQNYVRHDMFEKNGETTVIFSRKIKLCSKQDNEITGDTMRVLYAWNDEDPVENKYVTEHTNKGSKSLYLLDYGDRARQPLPARYMTYDLVMKNARPPDRDTTYMCKAFILPNMTGKHHLIRVDVIITPGNENHVHHMLLYQCEHVLDKDSDVEHMCFRQNMPDLDCDRETVIHSWAIGGTTYFYPTEVGLPLNVPGAPKYLLLEIHYDNPDERNDIVDSSGLRFIYTDNLRPIDAGILQMGLSVEWPSQVIPQRQRSFTSFAYCGSQCLNITNKKHYLFSAMLHSHTAGKKIVVRMIRDSDNVEVMKIAEDKNYDFNFQEIKHFKEPIEIPPGHSIDLECTYSTLDRPNPVKSGTATDEEMCLVYLFVYPKLNLRTCYSMSTAIRTFGQKELNLTLDGQGNIKSSYFTGGREFKDMQLNRALRKREFWKEYVDKPLVKEFERAGAEYPYYKQCKYADKEDDEIAVVQSQPRKYLEDEKCVNANKASLESVSKMLLFIVVLGTWRMFR